jgi:hypothetical protein
MPPNLSTLNQHRVLGEYGMQSLKPHAQKISWINAVVSFIAVVLGICGCVNYDNTFESLTAVPWTWSRTDMTAYNMGQVYSAGGIRAITLYTYDGDEKKKFTFASLGSSDGVLQYSYCVNYLKDMSAAVKTAKGYDRCVACNDAEGSVISMLSLAICCAMVAILMFVWRSYWDNFFAKDLSILASGFTWIFGMAAFLSFTSCTAAGKAYDADLTTSSDNSGYAAGGFLVLFSFIIAFLVNVLTLMTPVQGEEDEKAKPEPVATTEMTDSKA